MKKLIFTISTIILFTAIGLGSDTLKKEYSPACATVDQEAAHKSCLETFLVAIDAASKIIVILGFPFGYYQYKKTKQKEKRDREYGTYNALDLQYLEFQKLCLEHSDLNIFDIPDKSSQALNEKQSKQELIIFTMLFSIFERAYLLYQEEYSNQWEGWKFYIEGYCRRENFLLAWEVSGKTFDAGFEQYMTETIAKTNKEKAQDATA